MGKIIATIKIFPEDIIIPLDELREGIKKTLPPFASIHRIDEEPIAFGLVALIAHLVMPDSGGTLDTVEEAIKGIKGISEVETVLVRRV